MSTSITMPQLGESVTEGTVTRWLKNVGDAVAMDEPLLEVSTDKVDTEIPSPVAGVLLEIAAVEDDVVPVGGLLARVGEPAEAGAAERTPIPTPPSLPAEPQAVPEPAPELAPEPPLAAAPVNVTLPALGESVTEGTVTRWLKQVGDAVAVDEPLVEVSTDKVDTEIPSPVAGTLSRVLVAEDETVEVGAILAVVAPGASAAGAEARRDYEPPATMPITVDELETDAAQTATRPAAMPATGARPIHASPLVRRAARESGVDLATVSGTGVGGRITRDNVAHATGMTRAQDPKPSQPVEPVATSQRPTADMPVSTTTVAPPVGTPTVESGGQPRALQAPPTPQRSAPPFGAGAREREEPLPRLRRLIAARMVESLHVSAQLTTVVEIDVTTIALLRARVQSSFTGKEGVRLTFLPFFARATVEALRAHPALNASLSADGTTVTHHGAEHLGIAVDTDRGLLVPVVRDAGDLTLAALARRIADLAERTRSGRVTPDDLAGATFTLTNTGSRGALFDTPIISQPQIGILATGAVVKRPVVMEGRSGEDVIAIRSMAYFALTYDHRLVDGADAARFLATIKARLEQADFAAELGG